jgi:hypothetical protein
MTQFWSGVLYGGGLAFMWGMIFQRWLLNPYIKKLEAAQDAPEKGGIDAQPR